MNRYALKFFFCLSAVIVFACQSNKNIESASENHPNVVLILTDDQGWGDLSMHGNDKITTPVIDKAAESGAQFDRFYVSPLCAPTRASLLTGRYHLRTGTSWVSKGLENMHSEEVTIAEIFKSQGYKTGAFGKWHNGAHFPEHPNRQGFDEFIGFCAGHWNNYFNTTLEHNGEPYQTEGYISDVLTDEAIKFIENNQSDPFFCYIPYNAPHGPFQVPDRYFDKYKAMGFNNKDAAVYGMCENIDDNVGRIFRTLNKLKLDQNTIVVFMTDNGPNGERYNGGMRGIKGSIHEGGVRVPCFIIWQGHIIPQTIESIAGHIDMLPTLADLCNITLPDSIELDGVDLSNLLLGKEKAVSDRVFFTKKSTEFLIPDGALRSEGYRLVIENGDTMLFDMQKDPGETKDLSTEETDIRSAMVKSYDELFQEITSEYESNASIKIGYTDENKIYLPSHESLFSGDIHFKEGHGWAHDWLVNWHYTNDSVYWDVVVYEPATYLVEVLYSCPEDQIGAEISASCGPFSVEGKITQAHDPQYIQGNDRVVRKEVYEKEWAKLPLGMLDIPSGDQQIVLHASAIPNQTVGEIKGIQLTKIQ